MNQPPSFPHSSDDPFLERNCQALDSFVQVSAAIGVRPDYVQGGGGNTSVKLDSANMAIKASGFQLRDIRPDNAYAVLDYSTLRGFYLATDPASLPDVEAVGAAQAKESIRAIDGLPALRPSVEAGFHSLLDTYVAHSHAVYANFAACAAECDDIVRSAMAGAGYAYGIVPYVDPGARLTFAVRDELCRVESLCGHRPGVIFLKNHGVIAHADSPSVCLQLHEDANRRIAAAFGVDMAAYPRISLHAASEGLFEADCPYLSERLRSGEYSERFFLEEPLYPDQMVFLVGAFSFGGGMPEDGKCVADPSSGRILFRMPEKRALTLLETLTAVAFIAESIRRAGRTLVPMGSQQQSFIANWESEKYRRSLSERK